MPIIQYSDSELAEGQKKTVVYSNGDLHLAYSSPQSVYSANKDEQEWEVESVNLIKEMLTGNISTF